MDLLVLAGSPLYYALFIVIVLLHYFAFRKHTYSLLDPIVPLLLNLSFTGALILHWGIHSTVRPEYVLVYVVASIAFVLGFKITSDFALRQQISDTREPWTDSHRRSLVAPPHLNLGVLFYFMLILSLLNCLYLVVSYQNDALPILSDNPAVDRVAINVGHRWLSVLSTSVAPAGIIVSGLLAFRSRSRLVKLTSALVLTTFLLSFAVAGSKAAILSILFVFGTLSAFLAQHFRRPSRAFDMCIMVSILTCGLAYFVYVVSVPGMGGASWGLKLVYRTILSGHSYFYFFLEDQYTALALKYNLWTYLLHTITAPFGVRLLPFNIGVALHGASTGDYSGIGPNPQHVVEGMVFWGIYLAPLYSMTIGVITAASRSLSLNKRGNLGFIAFLVFFANASVVPIDITLWLFNVLAAVVVLVPTYVLSAVIWSAGWHARHRFISSSQSTPNLCS